jgi:hypothetical protein
MAAGELLPPPDLAPHLVQWAGKLAVLELARIWTEAFPGELLPMIRAAAPPARARGNGRELEGTKGAKGTQLQTYFTSWEGLIPGFHSSFFLKRKGVGR